MRLRLAGLAAALVLSGCATQIMNGFIGQTVQDVALRYGPPFNVMDMGDGRRAFQWKISQSIIIPTTSTTYGTANVYAPPGSAFATVNTQATTTTTPGGVSSFDCLYTMFGQWSEQRAAWVMTSYQRPNLMCM